MSTVEEIKAAVKALPVEAQEELAKWLSEQAEKERRRLAREQWVKEWKELADKAGAEVGPITWKREDLYRH